MHVIDHKPSRTILIDGKEYLFFSGTSYLGLSESREFQELIKSGLDIYGASFGSSRNGNLRLDIYEKAEKYLAEFAQAPAAVTLSSGMLAGQVVVNQLHGFEYIYSPQNHPANWHLPKIDSPKIPFMDWANDLVQNFPYSDAPKVIVCNSVDALRNEEMSFDWVLELPKNQEITLVVDDSHGIGVMGENGEGIFSKIRHNPNVRLIVTASLHKAMGVVGGVVLSDEAFIQQIHDSVFYSACSPIAPAILWGLIHSRELYQRNLQKLRSNIRLFNQLVADSQLFEYQEDYPVYWTSQKDLYDFLLDEGIFVYHFTYPAKTGNTNTRIVINAWHEQSDIERLAEACLAFTGRAKS